jgi:hypothetical protein
VTTSSRTLTVVATLLTAAIATGCGDGSGDDPERTAGSTEAQSQPVRAAFAAFERAFQAGDGAAACARLTGAARSQLAALRGTADRQPTGAAQSQQASLRGAEEDRAACPATVRQLARASRDVDQQRTRVLDVAIDGSRATLTVSDGGRAPSTLEMVRLRGEWLLATLGLTGGAAGGG